jgi:hypothetical protein
MALASTMRVRGESTPSGTMSWILSWVCSSTQPLMRARAAGSSPKSMRSSGAPKPEARAFVNALSKGKPVCPQSALAMFIS